MEICMIHMYNKLYSYFFLHIRIIQLTRSESQGLQIQIFWYEARLFIKLTKSQFKSLSAQPHPKHHQNVYQS